MLSSIVLRVSAALCVCVAGCAVAQNATLSPSSTAPIDRGPEDEIIYFVMPDRFENGDPSNDRGGIAGGRLDHGFDPTDNGFYHGGDLAGLTQRLDYIQGLGATAIWLTPIFENKPVQGRPGAQSAGYHGYWITDFTNVDPHLGTRAEFKAFVDAAHARGMKVYMDIITNHTADVIKYQECHGPAPSEPLNQWGDCPYRPMADYPFSTVGDFHGLPANEGFLGHDPQHLTHENFDRLTSPGFAYTPFVPAGEADAKTPSWLNDPLYYSNRGDSVWEGESVIYGDFAGLDDLMTQHPDVVQGMIEIYTQWITDYRVDGFRIDTAKHVNPEFWQEFTPAILDHAHGLGIDHFHVFGEVYEFDAGQLARFTHVDGLPAVLDFAFQGGVRGYVAEGAPAKDMARLFRMDDVYAGGFDTALQLPTFLGNHDMGRFAMFLRDADPEMSDAHMLARLKLAHAVMVLSRGVPTLYYGDEQGFISDGGDRPARENMFPSLTPDYNDNDLVGTTATTAIDNFDTTHPLYIAIRELSAVRTGHEALRRGSQTVRHADTNGGVLVLERRSPSGEEIMIIAFNAENQPRSLTAPVDARVSSWQSVLGHCPANSVAPGSMALDLPPLSYVVCRAGEPS